MQEVQIVEYILNPATKCQITYELTTHFVFTRKRSKNLFSVLTMKLYKLPVAGKQNTVSD